MNSVIKNSQDDIENPGSILFIQLIMEETLIEIIMNEINDILKK